MNLNYHSTDWSLVEKSVLGMQHEIAMAAKADPFSSQTASKQKFLLWSKEAKLLAFRTVITNKGGKTAGSDGVILSKEDLPKVMGILNNFRSYKCGSVRRVWIPKANSNQKRPLGIPNQIDRVWQALFSLALAPVVYELNCPRSYGYLKNRSARDAILYLKGCLNQQRDGQITSALLAIEADIKGFFDSINHSWLMNNTPIPYKHFLNEWLTAKVLDFESETVPGSGTPQGGIISPYLANITLAGLEKWVKDTLPKSRTFRKSKGRSSRKINVVRYADDFVITCSTTEDAKKLIDSVNTFLNERGLKLNEDKTRITKVKEGFDFLGFNFKSHGRRGLLVTPSAKSQLSFRERIREKIQDDRKALPAQLIRDLNPIIIGWANYFRICSTTETFTKMGHFLWHACLRWLRGKYPKAGIRTLYKEYFRRVRTRNGSILLFAARALDRRLQDVHVNLTNIAGLRVIPARWTLLKVDKNPYDLRNSEYFEELNVKRQAQYMDFSTIYQRLFTKQKGICPICNKNLLYNERLEVDHITPLSKKGSNKLSNKRLVHYDCHRVGIHGYKLS